MERVNTQSQISLMRSSAAYVTGVVRDFNCSEMCLSFVFLSFGASELSDPELEKVAGGTTITVAVSYLSAAVTLGSLAGWTDVDQGW
jgi:hypothetical protein